MWTEETFIRIYFIGPAGKNRRERKKVLSKHSDPPTETAFVENGMANIEQRCGAGMPHSDSKNSFVVFCARVFLTRSQHFAGPEANNLT